MFMLNKNKKIPSLAIFLALALLLIAYTITADFFITAGVLALIFLSCTWYYAFRKKWKGKIIDFIEHDTDDYHYYPSGSHRFAIIQLEDGKIKKVPAYPAWKKGDLIIRDNEPPAKSRK